MNHQFIVQKWSAWPPLESGADEQLIQKERLSKIPVMLRRRLSPLARVVFSAAIPCLSDAQHVPTVFSSTHGEIAKSFGMMQLIEAGEEISPTAFSLSVHNSVAGLFSIAFKNKSESTVIAPGDEGISAAFIEALGLLQEGAEQVLMVLYDEPLHPFYPTSPYKLSTDIRCAVALSLSKTGGGMPLNFSYQQQTGNDGEQALQVPLLIQFLDSQQDSLHLHGLRHSWCWKKL